MTLKKSVEILRGEAAGHGWPKALMATVLACPREAEHVYGPRGYFAWQAWADDIYKAYDQEICGCGLYLLIKSKEGE